MINLNDMYSMQDALYKCRLNEEATPKWYGHFVNDVETFNKAQKMLECDEMEEAHGFLYEIDYDNLTENTVKKVNDLYDLAINKGFINSEEESPENDQGVLPVDDPRDIKDPNVDPTDGLTAFTCLYSAMKNGEIKTGECYSNAADPQSAKMDAISKLMGLGFSSIEIIAVEAGDPTSIGSAAGITDFPVPTDGEAQDPVVPAETDDSDIEDDFNDDDDDEEDIEISEKKDDEDTKETSDEPETKSADEDDNTSDENAEADDNEDETTDDFEEDNTEEETSDNEDNSEPEEDNSESSSDEEPREDNEPSEEDSDTEPTEDEGSDEENSDEESSGEENSEENTEDSDEEEESDDESDEVVFEKDPKEFFSGAVNESGTLFNETNTKMKIKLIYESAEDLEETIERSYLDSKDFSIKETDESIETDFISLPVVEVEGDEENLKNLWEMLGNDDSEFADAVTEEKDDDEEKDEKSDKSSSKKEKAASAKSKEEKPEEKEKKQEKDPAPENTEDTAEEADEIEEPEEKKQDENPEQDEEKPLSDEEKLKLFSSYVKVWKSILKDMRSESYKDMNIDDKAEFWNNLSNKWGNERPDPRQFMSAKNIENIESLKIEL